jgi:hypothetical protein
MQNNRKIISAGELYVMLDREFRMRQARDCASCYILPPYRVDQPDHSRPNWEIIVPPDCAYGCSRIVEDLVSGYAKIYNLAPDNGND